MSSGCCLTGRSPASSRALQRPQAQANSLQTSSFCSFHGRKKNILIKLEDVFGAPLGILAKRRNSCAHTATRHAASAQSDVTVTMAPERSLLWKYCLAVGQTDVRKARRLAQRRAAVCLCVALRGLISDWTWSCDHCEGLMSGIQTRGSCTRHPIN